MKNYILLIAFLLFVLSGRTQNTSLDYKKAIKIYNLTTYEENVRYSGGGTAYSFPNYISSYQILQPTIAFQWKSNKGNFHEIELTNFTLNKIRTETEIVADTSGNVQTRQDDLVSSLISLRYEYILNFNKSKDKKFVPSLGFAMGPYFKQNIYQTTITNSLAYERFIGVSAFIIPRITYYLSSKIFFDINFPISIFDNYSITRRVENPAIPDNQQTTTNYNFNVFPKILSGRLGIGLKI